MAQNVAEEEAEKLVREYQVLQEQMRAVAMQLDQLQGQKAELERAGEEVGKSTGKVYLSVGGVIVETAKEKAASDIKERTELAGVRIGAMTKQFNDLKAKEKLLSDKLSQLYKSAQGGS